MTETLETSPQYYPDATECLANMLTATGQIESTEMTKPISHRIPVHLLSVVDAMAAKSNKSRNAMINLLIDVGVYEVKKQLPEDLAKSLESSPVDLAEAKWTKE